MPASGFVPPPDHTTRPTLRGRFGMCASTHWLASSSAQAVLERGGNAFDAAVAAGFVLHVVEPHLNGPGRRHDRPLRDRRRSPAAGAGRAGPRTRGGDHRALPRRGPRPGPRCRRARGGRPGLGRRLAAAAARPRDVGAGATCSPSRWSTPRRATRSRPRAADTVGTVADLFRDHWPTSAALWMPEGRPPAAGEVVRLPAYAATLRRLVESGADGPRPAGPDRRGPPCLGRGVRRGGRGRVRARRPTATPTVPTTQGSSPATTWRAGGRATRNRVTLDVPRRHDLQDRAVGTGPGPAAGACHPGRVRRPTRWTPRPQPGRHRVLEALKLALADRDAHYGDPDPDGGRRAAGDPALRGLRRRAAGPDRRAGVPRVPSRRHRRHPGVTVRRSRPSTHGPEAGAAAGEPTVGVAGEHPRRHLPPRRRRPVGQHRRRPRPRAAGCSPRRPSPSSASASAAGCR